MAEASFGGSVPEIYNQGMVPLVFEHYARDLVARVSVPSGSRVLELACGTGVVTRGLRSVLPASIQVVATDINTDMMSVAQRSLQGSGNVSFQVEDATNLSFEDESFDAVVCQFGVMFFPDKDQGYSEAARVLKPGGCFLFNVWDSLDNNPLFQCAHETVLSLFPRDPPMFLQIPFGYHDVDAIIAATTRAGFARTDVTVLPGTSRALSARDVANTFTKGTPLAPILAGVGAERSLEAVEEALVSRFGAGALESPMQAFVFDAAR